MQMSLSRMREMARMPFIDPFCSGVPTNSSTPPYSSQSTPVSRYDSVEKAHAMLALLKEDSDQED